MGYKYKTLEEATEANRKKAREYYIANKKNILEKQKQANNLLKQGAHMTPQQQYYYKNKTALLEKKRIEYKQKKEQGSSYQEQK